MAHRRWGKDELILQHTCCAAHERIGSYVHFLPEQEQARKSLWNMVNGHTGKRRIDEAFPVELRSYTRENEMSIGFHNGSTWQLAGSDNYNSIMGASYVGMGFSEYALGIPAAWGYFSPILAENNGWAAFITTPRGHNHAERLYHAALNNPNWFAALYTAESSGVFSPEQLQEELETLQATHGDQFGKSLWLQEYFCSFDAAIPGAIWGEALDKLQNRGMIGDFPLLESFKVYTAWDLGRTDATAIWFYQMFADQIRIFDYYEDNLKEIEFYADLLRDKALKGGFSYACHYLPHDAKQTKLGMGGKNIHQQMIAQKVGTIRIAPRQDHQDAIQAGRATFPLCAFDKDPTAEGIEALRNYHYEWDEEARVFTKMPKHDWSSHGASAFKTLSTSWRRERADLPKRPDGPPTPADNPLLMTMGQLRERHFKSKRAEGGVFKRTV